MGKINKDSFNPKFIFNNTILIRLSSSLFFRYKIDDANSFLKFNPETKEFAEFAEFGERNKSRNHGWWRKLKWKEMSKYNENTTT